ncbi:MAG: hypothetical protein HOH43_24975 [Candidatus Latescibacteria bacterium]|jgi:ectoine hydroxylase|nr:hypothetical protein [Candidatus Latescibacterota bacterium]
MTAVEHKFFERNGYLVVKDALTPDEIAFYQGIYDRDRKDTAYFWREIGHGEHQTVNCDSLVSSPEFDQLIRHPMLLPRVETLLGGPACLAEICLRHMRPHREEPVQKWHRDAPHALSHPLRAGWIHLLIYLSDVDDNTHCFSISPEACDDPILDQDAQLAQKGAVDIHGAAGTAVLFNLSVLHTANVRQTDFERKTVQTYYGPRSGPILSHYSLVPTELWRDHPNTEVRAFYGNLNDKSKRYAARFSNLGKQ